MKEDDMEDNVHTYNRKCVVIITFTSLLLYDIEYHLPRFLNRL